MNDAADKRAFVTSVSVIAAVRNEGAFIAKMLHCLVSQDYQREQIEIIIADGMSTDKTREIVEAAARNDGRIKLISNPGKIVSTGLNAAIREARGEVIVRVDGHTEIEPDYVSRCVELLERTGADNVGGRMNAAGSGTFGRAVAMATSSPFGIGNARFHYSKNEEWVDTVYLGAWKKDLFARIGTFDEEMVRNQDDEFNYRILDRGGRILLSPAIKSRYWVRNSIPALWSQYFQYGYWKVKVMRKHPRQMRPRQFVPAVFVMALASALTVCALSPAGLGLFVLLAAVYLAAAMTAALFTPAVRDVKELSLMPVVFMVLHLSYGSGFLCGLWAWSRPVSGGGSFKDTGNAAGAPK